MPETWTLQGSITLALNSDQSGQYGGHVIFLRESFVRAPPPDGTYVDPPADGPCHVNTWGYPDSTYSTPVSPGKLERFLAGEILAPDTDRVPWVSGVTFGARASGDVFPAFDAPDAIVVPSPLDVVLPELIDDEADLVLTWSPPFADLVRVVLQEFDSVDTGRDLVCWYTDVGRATVPANELQKLRWPSILGIERSTSWQSRVGDAELRIRGYEERSAFVAYDSR